MEAENSIQLTISILISASFDNVKRCLDSVQPLLAAVPSELILTDTGCSPRVRQLAEQYTGHILDFPWQDDFAAARNVGLREARGQWFLYVDDDEWFEDTTAISDFLLSEESDRYPVAFYRQRNYRDLTGKTYTDHYVDRLLRRTPELHFEHRIHEAYCGAADGEKKVLDAYVHHYGYVYRDEAEHLKKHERNTRLLEIECREYPENMRMHYQYVTNLFNVGDWDGAIRHAFSAIENRQPSEYWDMLHTLILYCYGKKQDWDAVITYGKAFAKKKLYPYELFGILEYLIEAYWHKKSYAQICVLAESLEELYGKYKQDPAFFNQQQIMDVWFVSPGILRDTVAYITDAAKATHNDRVQQMLAQGALKEFAPLVFDRDFFRQETRDGFVISPMMKCAWAAQLEILSRVDALCRREQISYFAAWGTLLGTIRHHGFIPWDDDIDICMRRRDLQRFSRALKNAPGYEDLQILNIHNTSNWGESAEKVANRVTFTLDRKKLKEDHGFPFNAGLDIFILDCVPRDPALEQEQIEIQRAIAELHQLYRAEAADTEERKQFLLSEIRRMTNVTFATEPPTEQELLILLDEVAGAYGEEDSDYYTQMNCLANGWDYHMPKDMFTSVEYMPFENFSMPVPAGYDWILRRNYGEDYMTPKQVGSGHGYPFYGVAFDSVAQEQGKTREEVEAYVQQAACDYYNKFLDQTAEPVLSYVGEDFLPETIEVPQDGAALQDGGETRDAIRRKREIFVTEDRKRIWAAQLEVYAQVKGICDANDIPLFAIGDTAEGAGAYGYYLPESEDLHLAMYRKDYIRFLELLPRLLDPWFTYASLYTEGHHEDLRCYVITDPYLCRQQDYEKRFHGCPHIVGVDIAPIDFISDDDAKEEIRRNMVEGLWATAAQMPEQPPYSQEILQVVQQWENLTGCTIASGGNLRKEFIKTADAVAGAAQSEGRKLCIFPELLEGKEKGQGGIYETEVFAEAKEMDFGPVRMLVPSFVSEPHEAAPQTEHPLLTISILISNHYDNVKHCLDSLEKLRQAVPTQLILTDTGCETKVRQLIAGYGDLILDFPWQKDFAAARNVGVKAALGDWFLFLDDDEWFEDTTPISDFFLSGERDNYDVAMYGTRSYLDPEGKTYREEMAPRLLRRTPEFHFVNKVHEEVRGVPMERCKMLDAYVHHYGYAFSSREEQMAKYRRNVELLEQEIGEDPANNRVRYLYVLECTYVRDWGEALHQGLLALKQPVRDEYREAIQVLMVRCYTEMQDWQQVVDQGKIFIKNKLRPYYELGILEYMTEAFWHQNKLPQVCALMEMVEMIYSEYQKDPSLFGSYSLVNMDFYSRERLGMCCGYALSAAEKMGKDSWAKDFIKGPLREFC